MVSTAPANLCSQTNWRLASWPAAARWCARLSTAFIALEPTGTGSGGPRPRASIATHTTIGGSTESLLVPFAPGGSGRFRLAVFDYQADTQVSPPEQQADSHAVLILDGIFLHRPELRANWDFSTFLHVELRRLRCPLLAAGWFVTPTRTPASNRRYVEGQRIYLLEARPWQYATVILDNTDLAAPAIISTAALADLDSPIERIHARPPGNRSADGLSLQAVSGELLVLDVETEHRDQCTGQEHARRDPERQ